MTKAPQQPKASTFEPITIDDDEPPAPATRRDAIKTGLALAATGATATLGLPALASNRDAELLQRVARFWTVYDEHRIAQKISDKVRADLEARDDYPAPLAIDNSREHLTEWQAYMARHGWTALWDRACELGNEAGEAAKAVFAVEARTTRGAFEKMKIARLAVLSDFAGDQGDHDLTNYQDGPRLWLDDVIDDLAGLIGNEA